MTIIETTFTRYRMDMITSVLLIVLAIAGIVVLFVMRKKWKPDFPTYLVPLLAGAIGVFLTYTTAGNYFTFRQAAKDPQIQTQNVIFRQLITSDDDAKFTPQIFTDVDISALHDSNTLHVSPASQPGETMEMHLLTDNLVYFLGDDFHFAQDQVFAITFEKHSNTIIDISLTE